LFDGEKISFDVSLVIYINSTNIPPVMIISRIAVPLQAWSGPEGSRKLRFPDFMTTAQDGGKVVSPYAPAAFTSRKYTWYSFLLEAESTPGP
jgi:hypothetical protein